MVKIGPPYRPHPDAVPGNTVNNTQDDETKTLVEENPKNSPAADDSKTKESVTPTPYHYRTFSTWQGTGVLI